MASKILGACLLAGSCFALAAAAMVNVKPADPVSIPVAYSRVIDSGPAPSNEVFAADDQKVVGLRSDRLALPSARPPATALDPVSAPSLDPGKDPAIQARFSNAQAMASPAEVEPETAPPRSHHAETRKSVRHKARLRAATLVAQTAKPDVGQTDKTAEVACSNGNSFLRALNLAPACN